MPRENHKTHFKVSLFTAFDLKGIMRNSEDLPPWNNSHEINEYFRRITHGKIALMGRKTYESLTAHEATNDLFSRKTPVTWNFVITKNQKYKIRDGDFACRIGFLDTLKELWQEIEKNKFVTFVPEIVVIGGVSLYKEMIDYADTIYAILYHAEFSGDEHFPLFFNTGEWKIDGKFDSIEKGKDGQIRYTFVTYLRKTQPKKFLPLLKRASHEPEPPTLDPQPKRKERPE